MLAELRAKAEKIRQDNEIDYLRKKQQLELSLKRARRDHDDKWKEIELNEKKILAEVESSKFDNIIAAIGQDTLIDIANSGPELQAKLLNSLGLTGYLMTDSNNPINLFSAANGMIGGAGGFGAPQ